jgi:hypothetical protein
LNAKQMSLRQKNLSFSQRKPKSKQPHHHKNTNTVLIFTQIAHIS